MQKAILNPKRLMAAPRLDVAKLVGAAAVNRDAIREAIPSFPDYLNGNIDGIPEPVSIGDCTCAAFADNVVLASAVASNNQATIPWPPQQQILNLFAEVAGLPDGTSPTVLEQVPGLDPVDVIQHVMDVGFQVSGSLVVPKAAALPPQDQSAVQNALAATVLYSAVLLHEGDEDQLAMPEGQGYLTTTYAAGAAVGGHMITPFSLEANGDVWIATYGGWIRSTIGWLMARGSAHFVLSWEPPVTPAVQNFGACDPWDWAGV